MATERFNATVQFPDKRDYLRLKAASVILDDTIGGAAKQLTDAEADRVGLKVPDTGSDNSGKRPAKAQG